MKKTIRLTESELINVIKKIINEQMSGDDINYKVWANSGGDMSGLEVVEIKRVSEDQGHIIVTDGVKNIKITDKTRPIYIRYFDNRLKKGIYRKPFGKYINVTIANETRPTFNCGSDSNGGCTSYKF